MADLVTPPWDLCGFDRESDPYALTEGDLVRFLWRCWDPLSLRGEPEVSVEPARDPNARDGEWREVVFMPHVVQAMVDEEGREVAIPVYPPVAEALFSERVRRRELQLIADVERRQVEWEQYWREVIEGIRGGSRRR